MASLMYCAPACLQLLSVFLKLLFSSISSGDASREQVLAAGRAAASAGPDVALYTLQQLSEEVRAGRHHHLSTSPQGLGSLRLGIERFFAVSAVGCCVPISHNLLLQCSLCHGTGM